MNPFLTKRNHSGRAHSKFSASGSERWMNCSGSVALCEKAPKRTNKWAEEGTRGHELLEQTLDSLIAGTRVLVGPGMPPEMQQHAFKAASFILRTRDEFRGELLVETRVYLDFIHPEMFGTFDSAVVDHFGTLHIFDYKYGVWPVSPTRNLQMVFYGIGLAHRYGWNFKRVRLWIIQPRIRNYDGPVFWDVPVLELKNDWVPLYQAGVKRVEKFPDKLVEGKWCHWCDAKGICPLKTESKNQKASLVFGAKFN